MTAPKKKAAAPEPPDVPSDSAKNDRDNTEVFVRLHRRRFGYDPLADKWLAFHDGNWLPIPWSDLWRSTHWSESVNRRCRRCHTWQPDADHLVRMAVEDIFTELLREAKDNPLPDPREQAKVFKHAVDAGNLYRINAVESMATTHLRIDPELLNKDKFLLGCENGVLDLKTGILRDGVPEDYITKNTGVAYDAEARCPEFDKFLLEIMEGDTELVAYLWRVIGYALTGDTSERAFFIFCGSGRNGKSTFVEVLKRLAGSYAQKARFSTFLEKYQASRGPNDDVAHLAGARVVIAAEASGKQPLDVALIKELTGGDTHRARHLYAGEFEFVPEFKLVMVTNHIPPIYETTEAIWDRLHYVPFEYRVPDDKVDRELRKKLEAELPGILAKAVAACREWKRDGLKPPAKVLKAKKDLYDYFDTFGEFINEVCDFKDGATVQQDALYRRLPWWWKRHGFGAKVPSAKRFSTYLKHKAKTRELEIKVVGESHHVPTWSGLQLKKELVGEVGEDGEGLFI